MELLTLAISPVLICLFYIFIRDKYEKEPVDLLLTGVIFGGVITLPIVHFENLVTLFIPNGGVLVESAYLAFAVAAFVEEAFKFIVLYFLIWHNRNLNEPFDGIVYAAFISLGFAGVENCLFIMNTEFGGLSTAFGRGVLSVPLHGIFGIIMGFYFALAKFEYRNKTGHILKAFFVPWFLHGLYNFILLSGFDYLFSLLILFVIFMWYYAFVKMKELSEASPFKIKIFSGSGSKDKF